MLVVWLFSKRSSSFIHQRYEDAKLQQKVQRHSFFFKFRRTTPKNQKHGVSKTMLKSLKSSHVYRTCLRKIYQLLSTENIPFIHIPRLHNDL